MKFYDPRKNPFSIHGLYKPETENIFRRMPENVAARVSSGVHGESEYQIAGGRIRFATDSENITIKFVRSCSYNAAHITNLTSASIDMYIDTEYSHKFLHAVKHLKYNVGEKVEDSFTLNPGMKELTINLPLYGSVDKFEIGLDDNAIVKEHTPYRLSKPVLYYGSSITQGACASRPGICYENIISRNLDCDYINLGFSGNAKAEPLIVDYMASLDVSAFVCDYDHNAPTVEYLRETHFRMYEQYRKVQPDTPYIMVSRPNFMFSLPSDAERRAVIMESYIKALKSGDKNVYFVDGAAFFAGDLREECVIDNTHPTDIGFERMANNIGDTLKYILFS